MSLLVSELSRQYSLGNSRPLYGLKAALMSGRLPLNMYCVVSHWLGYFELNFFCLHAWFLLVLPASSLHY